jgi:hypothetical protein
MNRFAVQPVAVENAGQVATQGMPAVEPDTP